LRRIDDPDDRPFLQSENLAQMIKDTTARGYAKRDAGEFIEKTSSIAVPVKRGDVVFGCISIIWIRKALSLEEAVKTFAGPLQEAAAAIPIPC